MPETGETALAHITKRSVLSNKRRFGFWERFLSSYTGEVVPATEATSMISNEHNDIEKGSHDKTGEVVPKTTTTSIILNEHNDIEKGSHDNTEDPVPGTVTRSMISNEHNDIKKGSRVVSHIRNIKKEMRNNEKARELVKILCKKIETLDNQKYSKTRIYDDAILTAAEIGVSYVVEEIMKKIPLSIHARKHPARHSIFHVAIENRSDDVFNLIHQMSDHKHIVFNQRDADWNNMLHLAGKLAPSHKLNEISGAALQMQRELQWFKEVEKLVHPSAKEQMNEDEKTPQMVFTDDHKILKEEGEKWMKETAASCTISAGLIATVMFAAAITVPGGTDGDNGVPIFSKRWAFITFAFSVAISLFASITSLLLFLAILTSRYAEEDFLKSLPKRLLFGLASLFLSLAFMMTSFAATLFLVFGQNKLWVLFTVLALVLLPVTSFVKTQLPLMRDLYSSTYGRGIFGKKSDRPFY